jgi:glycosyltransferase involved in cell wall biosynthesis
MKILMLNYEFMPLGGGAAPVTFDICKQLVLAKHQVDVVTMGYNIAGKSDYGKTIQMVGKNHSFNVYRVKCNRKYIEKADLFDMSSYILPAIKQVEELIKQGNKYDICHCHFILPTGLVAYQIYKKYHLPYIITSHGSDVPGYNPDRFILAHQLTLPLWKLITNNAKYITAPSARLSHMILSINGKLKPKVKIIHNGIIIDKQRYIKKHVILFAGRLFKRKGAIQLIKAFNRIETDWQLRIAGDGPELQNLKKEIYANSNIKLLGWLNKEDLIKEYKKSEIFVLMSKEESFGMSILEAMNYGNCIITTLTCKEVLGIGNGVFLEFNDIEGLAMWLRKLIKIRILRCRYQSYAKKQALIFSWDKIINQYVNLYTEAMK